MCWGNKIGAHIPLLGAVDALPVHAQNPARNPLPFKLGITMNTISYAAARANLVKTMKNVCKNHKPVVVACRGGPAVVMIALEDFRDMEATMHLLRSTANTRHPLAANPELDIG